MPRKASSRRSETKDNSPYKYLQNVSLSFPSVVSLDIAPNGDGIVDEFGVDGPIKDLQAFLIECVDAAMLLTKAKETHYADGGAKWEIKKYGCYLAVYVRDERVTYSIRLNTLNTDRRVSSVWFDPNLMPYYPKSLAIRCIRDFAELAHLCESAEYACEAYEDMLPRGTYAPGGYAFCSEHDAAILRSRSYIEGFILDMPSALVDRHGTFLPYTLREPLVLSLDSSV